MNEWIYKGRFREVFPDAEIAYICGDREFIGQQWLTYLMIDPIIPFRIRIRETDQISDVQKRLAASIIFAHLQPGQQEILSGRRWVWGRLVYISALRLKVCMKKLRTILNMGKKISP